MKNPLLSIVIPAFNEAENICNTARVVQENMKKAQIPYELIFVSDGSRDATFAKVAELALEDPGSGVWNFPGISAKRRLFLPDWKRQRAAAPW